ncbi:hypothetical protein U9M48_042867 [Paspalum notatum var. saurae]|uniref:Secreted protein n=1 Tax=Paspalum notatum var. saurae TaxID=547442 RepID=A0AAQ3URN8_PASNO
MFASVMQLFAIWLSSLSNLPIGLGIPAWVNGRSQESKSCTASCSMIFAVLVSLNVMARCAAPIVSWVFMYMVSQNVRACACAGGIVRADFATCLRACAVRFANASTCMLSTARLSITGYLDACRPAVEVHTSGNGVREQMPATCGLTAPPRPFPFANAPGRRPADSNSTAARRTNRRWTGPMDYLLRQLLGGDAAINLWSGGGSQGEGIESSEVTFDIQ